MIIYIIVIAILAVFIYLETRQNYTNFVRVTKPAPVAKKENFNSDWTETIQKLDLDPSVEKSHQKYINNVRQYSSGANFTSIMDDSGPIFSNYLGFSRPAYIPIDPSNKQVPDHDPEVMLRNRHISFTEGI